VAAAQRRSSPAAVCLSIHPSAKGDGRTARLTARPAGKPERETARPASAERRLNRGAVGGQVQRLVGRTLPRPCCLPDTILLLKNRRVNWLVCWSIRFSRAFVFIPAFGARPAYRSITLARNAHPSCDWSCPPETYPRLSVSAIDRDSSPYLRRLPCALTGVCSSRDGTGPCTGGDMLCSVFAVSAPI